MGKTLLIVLVLLALGAFVLSYNSLAGKGNLAEEKWAQVENQYQRRADLVPNLVSVVGQKMKQQEALVSRLSTALEEYSAATTREEKMSRATEMDAAIKGLVQRARADQELSSSPEFTALMASLEGTENRLSVERKRYNEAVSEYNNALKTFPGLVPAMMFDFREKKYFSAEKGAELAPDVTIDLGEEEKEGPVRLSLSARESVLYTGEETIVTATLENTLAEDITANIAVEADSGLAVTESSGCQASSQNLCKAFTPVGSKAVKSIVVGIECRDKARVKVRARADYSEAVSGKNVTAEASAGLSKEIEVECAGENPEKLG